MRIAIAGAHGKIGLRLVQILAARGDEVVGLIRNRDHASDVAAAAHSRSSAIWSGPRPARSAP